MDSEGTGVMFLMNFAETALTRGKKNHLIN